MIFVSLHVSLKSVAICVADGTGRLIREEPTSADAPSIAHYLEPFVDQVESVGLEPGPTSEWLTANLIEMGRPSAWKRVRSRRRFQPCR